MVSFPTSPISGAFAEMPDEVFVTCRSVQQYVTLPVIVIAGARHVLNRRSILHHGAVYQRENDT